MTIRKANAVSTAPKLAQSILVDFGESVLKPTSILSRPMTTVVHSPEKSKKYSMLRKVKLCPPHMNVPQMSDG